MEILIYCILYMAMTTHDICISCLFMAIVLLCIRDCYMYLQPHAKIDYYVNEWLVLLPGSSLLHFWDGFYNVFQPSCYPYDLTHQEAYVIDDFTTPGISHIYGLPYPFVDPLDPMDLYYPLMFQDHPQKLPVYTYTQLLKQYSRVYVDFDLKPAYTVMCAKRQISLDFSSYELEYIVSWPYICLQNTWI